MSTTQIRPYNPRDWKSVRAIYDLAKPDEPRGSVEVSAILPLDADIGMKALFQDSEIQVAECVGRVVGFAGTRGNRITWLFVHPAHRRQGVAESLLHHMLRELHGAVTLNVAKSNQAAVRLYKRLGFTIDSEFTGNFNGHLCQVMRLRYEAVG